MISFNTVKRRERILKLLEKEGPMLALDIADRLNRHAAFVYLDLVPMEEIGILDTEWEPRDDGKPRRRFYKLPG